MTSVITLDISNETVKSDSKNTTLGLEVRSGVEDDTNSFCTSLGYFADPNSTDCSSYIECQDNGDSTYTQVTTDCPDNTYYNPDTTLCDFDYKCTTSDSDSGTDSSTTTENPDTIDSSNSTSSTNSSVCTVRGFLADPDSTDCTSYIDCQENDDGSFNKVIATCTENSYFDPDTALCDFDYKCPSDSGSSTDSANVTDSTNSTWSTNSSFICTSQGYFADPDSTNCTAYIECQEDSGDYKEVSNICPENTFYNPNTTLCDFDYKCPTATDSDNSSSGDSDADSSDTDTTDTSNTTFNCTAQGFFADPDSTNCTSYIECQEDSTGAYTDVKYPCPDGTYYNPDTTLCDFDYKCPTETDSEDATFTCTGAGRFANSADVTCQTYYYCVALNDGTYSKFDYTCPSTSMFHPTKKICTMDYDCQAQTISVTSV
ncbi:unnamed protein product [Chrysodeixis includens]|uniref:Chitin-binding type-2 domain-containing protein n=1 Tax=Chrysodeixis includens TaxID=689277 RepID=A0A9P0G0S6_CHRIL|nr:unnamed protein product [Chrysodeixis includens]